MVKLKKKSIVGISASSFIILTVIILAVFLLFPTGITARAQEIERDFSSMEAKLDSIDLSTLSALSDTKLLIDESKELANIGIGGIPLLMEKLESGTVKGKREAFYIEGLYNLLTIDRMDILLDPEYFDTSSPYHPEYAGIKKLVTESKIAIPEIIASSHSVEDKIEELSKYGVLSIPYINNQIEKGENEYSSYFTKIGLQYTPEERIDMANSELEPSSDPSLTDEISTAKSDFDYEEWNNTNHYDLEILSNYIAKI